MSSKLALHVQGHESWTRRSRARYIKVIDPSGDNKWPNHRVIGRVYVPDGVSNEIVARGSVGARVWLEHCLRAAETAPYVWMWLAPNEPQPMVSLDFCQRLSEFTGEWAHMMREQGLRAGGGTISEGNPPGATEDEIRKRVEAFAPGLSQCDAWLYHGYWVEKAQHREAGITVWHALRYRMIYQFAKDAGYTLPTCFIGECGNDGGVIGDKGRGWRTYCGGDRRAYMQELARFDAELAKDPYVEAAFVFTAGANNDWRDFEVDEQLGDLINEHITAQGGAYVPAVQTPATAPDPLPVLPSPSLATVTAFSQRDPRWLGEQLGTGKQTIGQAGCLISSVASLLSDWGMDIDPLRLNAWLRSHGGYSQGNLFVWGSVAPLGARLVELINCELTAAPVAKIQAALAAGAGVIIKVDMTPGGKVDSHWVRLTALADRSGHIVDPWQLPGGELTSLERYLSTASWTASRGIFAAGIYERGGATRDGTRGAIRETQEQLSLRGSRGPRSDKFREV